MGAMGEARVVRIREEGGWAVRAAAWFHARWGVPEAVYRESLGRCAAGGGPVPQWYLAVAEGAIVGGVGVIANDFHDRPDLSPNVCALFVEPSWRRRGIARRLLRVVCGDFRAFGLERLYLVTEHTAFYERLGWAFLGFVNVTDGPGRLRLYARALR